jgi:glutamine synthetase
MPGQLEFQVGPCKGIDIGDHLWMARYLLGRVAEDFKISVSYDPKMFKHFAGSGGHLNFSTKSLREKGGLELLKSYMEKLSKKHTMHLELYGDNSKRLSGEFETSKKDTFTWGFGDRGASVRIPTVSIQNDYKTYIEDRRPASDIDPYVVGALMIDTLVIDGPSKMEELYLTYQKWQAWRKDADIPQA